MFLFIFIFMYLLAGVRNQILRAVGRLQLHHRPPLLRGGLRAAPLIGQQNRIIIVNRERVSTMDLDQTHMTREN